MSATITRTTAAAAASANLRTREPRRGMDERRIVTVLFCDVVRSSYLAEQLGPEDWADVMQEAFERLIEPVERYDGSIGRLMGDAILAFFGAPNAHEDDPQRAIMAGLAILDAIQPLRDRVLRTWGLDFNVRIGINTGVLVVGDFGSRDWFEYTAMGDAINLAAKIQQAGQGGRVHVATATYRLTEPLFAFEPAGEIEIGGAGRREAVYRVVGQLDVAGKLWDVAGMGAPLVGREAELDILRQAFDRLSEGQGGIIFLVGEAGLGKSRLLDELRRYREASGKQGEIGWVENRLISYEASLPYGALQSRFRKSFGIQRHDSPEVVHTKLNQVLAPFPADIRARAVTVVERALSIGGDGLLPAPSPAEAERAGQEFRRELYSVALHLLRGWNGGGPLVFVSDDQHWSDAPSADVLLHAMQLVESMPILFVCALRPETHRPVWSMKETAQARYPDRTTEIRLRPLESQDSARLIDAFLGGGDAPAELRRRILERAEGNPLFVEEMVRSLIDRGLLEACGDDEGLCWKPVAGADLSSVVIPDSLQGLFQERVDRLDPVARQVLQQAAVVGRTFYKIVLAELTDPSVSLDDVLETLSRADLIRESSQAPEQEFAFRHPLILETVYQAIPRRRRQEFHLRVGEVIERLFATRLDERAGRIGHHYYEAADPRAVDWLVRAAEQAQRVYEPNAVLEVLRRAEELATRLSLPMPPAACLLRGHAHELTGDYDAAREDFQHALEVARASADARAEWEALIGLGLAWSERDYPRAGQLFQQALALARSIGDDTLLARSLNRLGNWYSNLEQPDKGIEVHSEALEIFHRVGSEAGTSETLDLLGIARFLAGDLRASAEVYDDAIALFSRLGDRRGLASSLAMRVLATGSEQSLTVDPRNVALDDLVRDGERALDLTRDIRWQAAEAFTNFCLASALHVRGEFSKALTFGVEGLQIAESIEHRQWTLASNVAIAAVEFDLGMASAARQRYEYALAIAHEIGSVHWRRSVSALLASVLIAQGAYEDARRMLDSVVSDSAAPTSLAQREGCYHRAVLRLATGQPQAALDILDQLVDLTPGSERRPSAHVGYLRGRALTALGRVDEAEAALLAARRRAESLGFRPLSLEIELALAELYTRVGRAAEAEDPKARADVWRAALAAAIDDPQLRAQFVGVALG
ncbi:MAG: hypothetical protein DCC58_00105 [Chloroflexi bacterium]|nr:MAG: hypothetical protein DCC58_00105 [Chloroflexota bacterium]